MSAAASSLTTPRVITLLVCSCKTSISWSTFSLKNKRKITHATVTDKPWVQHRNSIVSTYWSRICSTVVDMIFASSCSVWCSSSRSISVTDLIWSTVYSSSKRVLHRGQVIGRFSLDRCFIQDTRQFIQYPCPQKGRKAQFWFWMFWCKQIGHSICTTDA